MTDMLSSFDVVFTPNWLAMLIDLEVDSTTMTQTLINSATGKLSVMFLWDVLLTALRAVWMTPRFFEYFTVLPLLGHAKCHLYDKVCSEALGRSVVIIAMLFQILAAVALLLNSQCKRQGLFKTKRPRVSSQRAFDM